MPSIKRRSTHRGDGEIKNKTKNCEACQYHVNFWEKEVCGWGVSFKYLSEIKNPKKCEYFKKEPPENNSFEYVKYVVQNNLFGRSKRKDALQLKLMI